MTQIRLAEATGFSQGQVSAYEHGQVKDITLETLSIFGRATGTPIQTFLSDVPPTEITLAEVLRRDYPNMDAGTIETLEKMARFLYEEYQRDAAQQRGKRRRGGRVAPGTEGNGETINGDVSG